jgi:hypothetical protein
MRLLIFSAVLFALLLPCAAFAQARPGIPEAFYGNAAGEGGTVVTTSIEGAVVASTTIAAGGVYGYAPTLFIIQDPEGTRAGQRVSFAIGGARALETAVFIPGALTELDLTIATTTATTTIPADTATTTASTTTATVGGSGSTSTSSIGASVSLALPLPKAPQPAPQLPALPTSPASTSTTAAVAGPSSFSNASSDNSAASLAAAAALAGSIPAQAILIVLSYIAAGAFFVYALRLRLTREGRG